MSEEKRGLKKDKKRKDKKLKRQRQDESADHAEDDTTPKATRVKDGDDQKVAKRLKREKKRQEKAALMKKLPLVDEHGISYTKQQLRRMRKRVARGLDPLETPREKHERMLLDAKLRKEEEAELDGRNDNVDDEMDEGSDNEDDDTAKELDISSAAAVEDNPEDQFSYEKRPKSASQVLSEQPVRKKKKRDKAVPSDYVCFACKETGNHWIYDCPEKVTKRGTNQVSKKARGLQQPSDCKLFVSGLPFDATSKDVIRIFAEKGDVTVQSAKLIKFEDTGRCKGQAYLAFESSADAKKALALNGVTIENIAPPVDAKRKKVDVSPKRKELKLKVTKVLSRFATTKMKK